MLIFFGLGNPEPAYALTRHNAGVATIDFLAGQLGLSNFKLNKKCAAWVIKHQNKLILAKNANYMNESGRSVKATINFYGSAGESAAARHSTAAGHLAPVSLTKLYIFHDDLDLPLGHFKIQLGTGPKVHNGLTSVYDHLGTKQFWHVRLGVDSRQGSRVKQPSDYVLEKFTPPEHEIFQQVQHQLAHQLAPILQPYAQI